MAEQVTCIVKGEPRFADCRCITELRTGTATYTREQAHDLVKRSPGALYVQAGASRSNVIPAEREGLKYVRTAPNDTTADNLLSVRRC